MMYVRSYWVSVVVLGACLVAGCSSSSSPASSGSGGGNGGAGGKDICALITQADVQALVNPTITGVTNVDGVDCNFANSGEGIKVDHYDTDTTLQYYDALKSTNAGSTVHQLQGVGDMAYWNEAVDGKAPPELIAHKGTVTCVLGSPDVPDTTCKTSDDGSGVPAFADSDAAAYVQLMAKVCTDVFNVDN